jgi:hypothetical protein
VEIVATPQFLFSSAEVSQITGGGGVTFVKGKNSGQVKFIFGSILQIKFIEVKKYL